ncbi:MAG: hypothetical protein ACFFDI_14570 [Promethearchaeota archaeon]
MTDHSSIAIIFAHITSKIEDEPAIVNHTSNSTTNLIIFDLISVISETI